MQVLDGIMNINFLETYVIDLRNLNKIMNWFDGDSLQNNGLQLIAHFLFRTRTNSKYLKMCQRKPSADLYPQTQSISPDCAKMNSFLHRKGHRLFYTEKGVFHFEELNLETEVGKSTIIFSKDINVTGEIFFLEIRYKLRVKSYQT